MLSNFESYKKICCIKHGFPGETQVLSLGREDPLEEGMVTHPSILA